jgi:hypothetical protein
VIILSKGGIPLLTIFEKARKWFKSNFGFGSDGVGGVADERAWALAGAVMSAHHFTPEAQRWIKENVRLRVDSLDNTSGGGYWQPERRLVRLFTAQHEAAVHELAHAWWHYRREPIKDEMIEATVRLSAEQDPRYAAMQRLAHGYIHGIPEQPWEGLYVTRNDWEMFAGLASGSMGDMRRLPPYVQRLYKGLFVIEE